MARATSGGVRSSQMQELGLICALVVAACAILWPSTASAIEAPSCTAASQQSIVMNFFIHDNLAVTPGSAFMTVPALTNPNGVTNTNLFGSVAVFDDSITEGPEVTSKEVARGRGFYVFDHLSSDGTSLEFVFTAVFTNLSDYEGSTLTFKGYDLIDDVYREIAITGGTGAFRLARGWAGIYTYFQNGGAAILNTTCVVYYGCNYGLNVVGSGSGRSQTLPSVLKILAILAFCSFLVALVSQHIVRIGSRSLYSFWKYKPVVAV